MKHLPKGIREKRLTGLQTHNKIYLERRVDFIKQNFSREFTSTDIEIFDLFPWARSSRARTRMIQKDAQGKNLLRARIEGEGRQRRYFIKAENLIYYIEKYGDVLIPTDIYL